MVIFYCCLIVIVFRTIVSVYGKRGGQEPNAVRERFSAAALVVYSMKLQKKKDRVWCRNEEKKQWIRCCDIAKLLCFIDHVLNIPHGPALSHAANHLFQSSPLSCAISNSHCIDNPACVYINIIQDITWLFLSDRTHTAQHREQQRFSMNRSQN